MADVSNFSDCTFSAGYVGGSKQRLRAHFSFKPARPTSAEPPVEEFPKVVEAGVSLRSAVVWYGASAETTDWVILYCARGRGCCEFSGWQYKICAGDVLIFPVCKSHDCGLGNGQPCLVAWVQTSGLNLTAHRVRHGEDSKHPMIDVSNQPRLRTLFDRWMQLAAFARSSSDAAQASQLVKRIVNTVVHHTSSPCNGDLKIEQRIRRIVEYMESHVDEQLDVAALAALARTSQSHFFAAFKHQMGCTPIEHLTRLRVAHACHLLDSTPLKLRQIAAATGYRDPFYLSRVFKSTMGVSPRDYRARTENVGDRRELAANHL